MKFSAIWATALTLLGITEEKKTATDEDITKANAELKPTGLQLVTEAQAAELAGLAALKEKAAQLDEIKPKLDAANATMATVNAQVKETLEACGLKAEAGKEFDALVAHAKGKPGEAHTGTKTEAPKQATKYTGHDEALASMDPVAPSSVKPPTT